MNRTTVIKYAKRLALGLAVLALAATPSIAQTIDLCATTGTVVMPGGESVDIWGYVLGSTCTAGSATIPGPVIRATAGVPLTINLTNNLTEPVSFFVPGLPESATPPFTGLFTNEAAALGGTASYSFTPRAGTFLYHSATDRIRTQVPMGLYGALVADVAAGQAYADVSYDSDQVLVYSEIDPLLNVGAGDYRCSETLGMCDPEGTAPVCPGEVTDVCTDYDGAKVINWRPQYFLINGQAYPNTTPLAITTGDNVLLRFVNAGLDSVMPTLGGGLYMDLKAEDGNRYPHPIQQYGLDLQAGKTIDAMIQVTNPDTYAIYDRSGLVTNGAAAGGGMIVNINAAAGAGLFQLSHATYSVAENGGTVTVTVNRVGGSAGRVPVGIATADGTATAPAHYTAIPVGTVLIFADAELSKSFNIDINNNLGYQGDRDFTVNLYDSGQGAVLGTPSSAVVTILEDDPGPGVLQLSAATYSVAENGVTLTVTVNRVGGSAGAVSVDYATADGTAIAPGDYTADSATLTWADGDAIPQDVFLNIVDNGIYEGDKDFSVILSNPGGAFGVALGTPSSAIATITEDDPLPNQAPIANDDTTTSTRGTTLSNYDIVGNDEDLDGTIDATSVVITTGPMTQRGGTVINNGDGTITFDPVNNGWTGTDTFQYTVNDNEGATSNVATVHINVVK